MSGIGLRTVNDVLAKMAGWGRQTAILWQDAAGEWAPISCEEVYGRVRAVAGVLQRWGIQRGDRVVILSENRWEWAVADFAVLAIGAVSVPLYATNTAEQVGYMVRDSGARVVFVSSAQQRAKLVDAGGLPAVERVVVMNQAEEGSDDSFHALLEGAAEKMTREAGFDAMLSATDPDDLCTIIYTSGTTGEPKGVELTHGNLASNINPSWERLGTTFGDRFVEFLPLSHVYARHVDYLAYASGAVVAHVGKIEYLPNTMKAVRPTVFIAVPRLFEKIRHGVEAKSAASPVKRRILAWAVATGRKHREEIFAGRTPRSLAWKLADRLVYSKIREAFGGSVKMFVSGSAALGIDTAGWFADVGIRVFEGYGLTETSPVVAVNYPGAHRAGTIGLALPNMEVRLAEDGEVEVRGPAVFKSYWKKPTETAEVFTDDGWFKTGDIGAQDAEGYLSITDRKKEILKTSGGKMIAPQSLENRLKSNVLVGNAAVVGDKHKFVSVLISPNLVALRAWAKANGLAELTSDELVGHTMVCQEYQRIVDCVNKSLAPYETMKKVAVVRDEWGVETGELTSTLKLKRRVVNEKYAALICDFYKNEATSREQEKVS